MDVLSLGTFLNDQSKGTLFGLTPTNLTPSAKNMAVYYDESLNRDHSETC